MISGLLWCHVSPFATETLSAGIALHSALVYEQLSGASSRILVSHQEPTFRRSLVLVFQPAIFVLCYVDPAVVACSGRPDWSSSCETAAVKV